MPISWGDYGSAGDELLRSEASNPNNMRVRSDWTIFIIGQTVLNTPQ
jgi:hypothetical protein|uniref:Uncharacterized protein n=2 Tax=Picea TaxID=3328 RepID=A0A101LX99_PICGL|nr:hypothetical protein ABT39_MTgene6060 [Picea glauca]QHR91431.1 hypothetical protein Q903MT_gene5465 [Picea sitchensis]